MVDLNSERALVSILRSICKKRGISLTPFSSDWIFHLQFNGRSTRVFGYDFEVNSATGKMIARDKAATSDLLQFLKIPHVEHCLFHGPQLLGFVPMTGNWTAMLEFFERHNQNIVCKPNEGTGGRGVFRARSPIELELAVHRLFTNCRSISLSPYESFESEFRVAILNGEVEFVYRKKRPSVVGDGKQSIQGLALDRLKDIVDLKRESESLALLAETSENIQRIPAKGEIVSVNWRHNLGQGAAPELLDLTAPHTQDIVNLAKRALQAVGITLASVDIVETDDGLKVLEINSGIMMESFVKCLPEGYAIAEKFYDKIVCYSLGL